jgi:predicted transcriptional regulator
MTASELANSLFDSINKTAWIVSYEENTITLTHSKANTEVDWIEIDLTTEITTAMVSGQRFHISAKITDEQQAKQAIIELLDRAAAYQANLERRIRKAIKDIGE